MNPAFLVVSPISVQIAAVNQVQKTCFCPGCARLTCTAYCGVGPMLSWRHFPEHSVASNKLRSCMCSDSSVSPEQQIFHAYVQQLCCTSSRHASSDGRWSGKRPQLRLVWSLWSKYLSSWAVAGVLLRLLTPRAVPGVTW